MNFWCPSYAPNLTFIWELWTWGYLKFSPSTPLPFYLQYAACIMQNFVRLFPLPRSLRKYMVEIYFITTALCNSFIL